MSYFTVKGSATSEFQEKKSTFIGYIKRVNTEEEAKNFVNEIKSMHKEATHNVYAYIVGENKGIQRYSDDGEPQGTAGIPVLEVIKKNDLTDVAVVVTRYFGGILLGGGGLIRAYSKGASSAIEEAGVVEKVKGLKLRFTLEYDLIGKIQYLCGTNNWHIEDTIYTDKVELSLFTEVENKEIIIADFVEATSGKVTICEEDEEYLFKEGYRYYRAIEG
ncbi:MAG: YigZ family protein [Clostridium sulfidigenes]|uniref:YigZ family protein n=1 Tax=Clostridium sulfidigenes TaxID=318464 RepID=A0A927ZV67_9CLOT|nr:YigZ family protein [Clostridium sulfidigenes]